MKLNLGVFTHALSEKLSPKFLSSNPRQKKINHSHSGSFFSKISPPGRKWVERGVKTMVLNKSQLVCCLDTHRKSIHTLFQTWDIRPSGPIWSDLLRVFSVITQDLEFYHLWNLGWEVNYRNDSRFRPFSYKKNTQSPFLKFLAQIWAKMSFLPKLGPVSS